MSINPKNPHFCILTLSIASLIFAYYVEYIMSSAICPLCVYQRFPYLILIMISLIGLADERDLTRYYVAAVICSIVLAAYHTGIERGIFELSAFCTASVPLVDNLSVTDFKNIFYNEQIGICNKPALVIFGLSITEWNLIFNIILLTALIAGKNKQVNHAQT